MISSERVKEYVLLGEGFTVDFKQAVPSKVRELTEEVCSFANAAGGFVLIGVNNKGEIVGANIDNDKRSAIQGSIGEISPALHCHIYMVEVDGRQVWVIEVPAGINKPYSFGGCIYMREGANAQKLTHIEEIREMFQNSGKVYFDATPLHNFDLLAELDRPTMSAFRREAAISFHVDDKQLLDNLQCFDINSQPKQGAVMFFACHPEERLSHAVTRCVRYKGVDKSRIIDDKTFGGPLLNQYEQAMAWLKSGLTVEYNIVGTGARSEKWEIPLEVFKESIINSLSHRDYNERGAFTMIEMYDDRVEISNPGGLLPQVVPNFGRKSLSRNPYIFDLLVRMNMVEHVGSGIARMRADMLAANLPEPIFETEGFFTVTFMRRPTATLTPLQEAIVKAFADNPGIKISDLTRMLGKSKSHIYNNIKQLKSLGRL